MGSQYPSWKAGFAWPGSGDVNNTQRVSIHQTSLMSLALRGSLHPSLLSCSLSHLFVFSLIPQTFSHTSCCLLSSTRLYIYLSPALITLAPTNLSTGNNMFTLHNKLRTCLKTQCVSGKLVYALSGEILKSATHLCSSRLLPLAPALPRCPNMFFL